MLRGKPSSLIRVVRIQRKAGAVRVMERVCAWGPPSAQLDGWLAATCQDGGAAPVSVIEGIRVQIPALARARWVRQR